MQGLSKYLVNELLEGRNMHFPEPGDLVSRVRENLGLRPPFLQFLLPVYPREGALNATWEKCIGLLYPLSLLSGMPSAFLTC